MTQTVEHGPMETRRAPACQTTGRRSGLLLDRAAGRRPCGDAAGDVAHIGDPHVLQRLGGERRATAGSAEQDEFAASQRLVVHRAFGVGEEFEEAARRMDGPRQRAGLGDLVRLADVDELDAGVADEAQGDRLWAILFSSSMFLVVLASPVIGAIADAITIAARTSSRGWASNWLRL